MCQNNAYFEFFIRISHKKISDLLKSKVDQVINVHGSHFTLFFMVKEIINKNILCLGGMKIYISYLQLSKILILKQIRVEFYTEFRNFDIVYNFDNPEIIVKIKVGCFLSFFIFFTFIYRY